MLLSLVPPSWIPFLVGPSVNTIAMLFIVSVITLVHPTILPGVDPEIIHYVSFPMPKVSTPITPLIVPISCDLVVLPLSFVNCAICPEILAYAIFATLKIFSCELWGIRPRLSASSVLQILLPLSFISGLIWVGINSKSMSFIVTPASFVHFSLCVSEAALTDSSAQDPFPLKGGSIWPSHMPMPVTESA